MTEEDKISEALIISLAPKNQYPKIEFGHRKEVLIGCTCGYYEKNSYKNLCLLFQSAEQDIVVYLKDDKKDYLFEGSKFFRRFPQSLTDNKILIPLVIFEVKYGKVNTHTIRQYSELARMIKTIFPFCLYNLLLIDIEQKRNADKTYMAGKSFDKIIYKSGYAFGNDVHNELVETMWNIVKAHIDYLKEEKYFRLTTLM